MGSYEPKSSASPAVMIGLETDTPRGWAFEIDVETDAGRRRHEVSMSYADHDHWSGGSRPPSAVIKDVLLLLASRVPPDKLPERFDAALARRLVDGFDRLLRSEADWSGD
ncbi:MAG: hypothetical protein AAFR38_12940 [Planctomycetota bacterium]